MPEHCEKVGFGLFDYQARGGASAVRTTGKVGDRLRPCFRRLARALIGGLIGCGLALSTRAQAWQRASVLSRLGAINIVADPAGFVWVSTETGVFRYDGHQVVPPNHLLAPGRLPATSAYLLFQPDGALWCGTQQGLFCFVPATRQLERVALPPLPNGRISIDGLNRHPRTGRVRVSYGGVLVVLAGKRAVGPPVTLPEGVGLDFDDADGAYLFGGNHVVWHLDGCGRPQTHQPATGFRWHSAARDTMLTSYFDGDPPPAGLPLAAAADDFGELVLALTDQTTPEPARYTCRLAGDADQRFRPVVGGYRLRLDHLVPGDYVIELQGQTAHGTGAHNRLRVPLRVAGHWWRPYVGGRHGGAGEAGGGGRVRPAAAAAAHGPAAARAHSAGAYRRRPARRHESPAAYTFCSDISLALRYDRSGGCVRFRSVRKNAV